MAAPHQTFLMEHRGWEIWFVPGTNQYWAIDPRNGKKTKSSSRVDTVAFIDAELGPEQPKPVRRK